jgi:hypothetical protein
VREDIRATKRAKAAYAVRIIKQVEEFFECGENYVVVDGLYSWTEYKIFKESFGDNAMIIAVVSPRECPSPAAGEPAGAAADRGRSHSPRLR